MTTESTAVPDKDTTVKTTVPDKDTTESRTYAGGKFDSLESLEKGYQDLQQFNGKQAEELGGVKQQLSALNENMMTMQQAQQQQAVPPAEQQDFAADQQQVYKEFDSGTIDEKVMSTRLANIAAAKVGEQASRQHQSALEKQGQDFTDQLAQRDQQALYNQFIVENPEFEQLMSSGQLDEMVKVDPYIRDHYDAYYKIQASNSAALAQTAATEAFEKGKAETLAQVSGSNPAKGVTGASGQQLPVPAGAEQPQKINKAQLMESGLAAFRGAA